MGIFITGTDTNVGKTTISAWVCAHTGAKYWKPIQSCDVGGTDTDLLKATGAETYPESYRFKNPFSPHIASAMEGITIDLSTIIMPQYKSLVAEGAGGVLVPIVDNYLMIDLMASLNLPVLVVARSTTGTINHTCLTLEALRNRNIPVLGVVTNGPYNADNNDSIEQFGKAKVLASFPLLDKVNGENLRSIPLPLALKEVLEANL